MATCARCDKGGLKWNQSPSGSWTLDAHGCTGKSSSKGSTPVMGAKGIQQPPQGVFSEWIVPDALVGVLLTDQSITQGVLIELGLRG